MLSLDYIKDETLWVVQSTTGYRTVCKGSELKETLDMFDEDYKDHDTAIWKNQPKELQEFWHAHENATWVFNRYDLYNIDDFYKEWIKNPQQFDVEHRPVLPGTLRERLSELDPNSDLIIVNYDKYTIGNHYAKNFTQALDYLELDFDVVEFDEGQHYSTITIQSDNEEELELFNRKSNSFALDDLRR